MIVMLAGCAHAQPSSAPYPAPLSSAAQPAAAGKGDLAYARRGAEAIRLALRDLEPEHALREVPRSGIQTAAEDVVSRCVSAEGAIPVLLCSFGPAATRPVAQALFWNDQEAWQAQLYPQAAPIIAQERRESLAEWKCQIGCFSTVTQARLLTGGKWPELLVVVDLGTGGEVKSEEAQLLRLANGAWEVLWVPQAGNWNYGHAAVTLPSSGGGAFRVRSSSLGRKDMLSGYLDESVASDHRWFDDRWERRGDGYFLRDRSEESSPYATLLRVIHYLTIGSDEKAQAQIAPGVSLEAARKALAQRPKRQGWSVTRIGEAGFRVKTGATGEPEYTIQLAQQDGRWVVTELKESGGGNPQPSAGPY